jgi:hypothetical protein
LENSPEFALSIIKEYEQMAGTRWNWESHWQEIAERVMPMHSRAFTQRGNTSKGDKRNDYVFDSTAAIALNRFSAILDSLLTPRNGTWHRLTVSDRKLGNDRRVKLYFEEANQVLFKYRYSPKANFAAQNQQNYKGLGAYGTACLFVDQLKDEPGVRYKDIHLGEVFIAENHQGVIDKAIRYFPLTARQAFKAFGDKIPDRIKEQLKINPETEFYFIHCVKPREDRDIARADYKGMPYAAYYVAVDGPTLLKEEGFQTFPYAISRYEQAPGEVYGRSPAMDVLPAIKTLNEEKKTLLKQGHRAVDPVLLAHDDGILDSFSLKPGAINAGGVSADGRLLVQALPTGNLAIGKDMMDDERSVINDAFLVTLFQILVESPTMTATEVMERTREKGILLAPTIGRQQDERLGPMIERELDLLSRQGLLPPMPEPLIEAGGEYRVVYDSPLSKAQRAEEAAGLMRTIEMALNVVNVTQNPEPLDHFNWDIIVPEISDIQGVPSRWMKDPKIVSAMRQQRAEAAQEQAMIQAAPGAAAMVSSAAKMKKAGA